MQLAEEALGVFHHAVFASQFFLIFFMESLILHTVCEVKSEYIWAADKLNSKMAKN